MHNKNITIKYLIFSIFIFSVFTFGNNVLAVWDYPENSPVERQVSGAFSVNNRSQQKNGAFIVGGGFRSTNAVIFDDTFSLKSSGYASGKVLTSDAEGNATWQDAPEGGEEGVWGEIDGEIEDQEDLMIVLNAKAPIDSPVFTGNPTVVTQSPTNNSNSIASTAFVTNLIAPLLGGANGWTRTTGLVTLNNLFDNLQIGENTIIYRGGSADANRFVHTNGTNNLFAGLEAGNLNISGQGNTGAGRSSLFSISSGSYNTALGFESLYSNTSGSYNTAAGYRALYNNNANYNTGAGVQALNNNVSGEKNTALGHQALFNATGSDNTNAGTFFAGPGVGSGSSNTYIGSRARPDIGALDLVNAAAIGYDAVVAASNTMVFGNSSVTGWGFAANPQTGQAIIVGSSGNNNGGGATLSLTGVWSGPSDLNKKTNIQNLNYGLKEVLQLRPVSFNWKDSNTHDIGFIAQEVKEIVPELVYGTEGDLSLAYSQVPVVLVGAIKEQQKEIEEYRLQLESLKERLEKLKE